MNREQTTVVALGALLLLSLGIAIGAIGTTVDKVGRAGAAPAAGDPSTESGQPEDRRVPPSQDGPPGASGAASNSTAVLTTPTSLLALAVGVAVLAVAAAIRAGNRDGDEAGERDDSDGGDDQASLADVGRAAGRAANRMEDADPENAVYGAWFDMTRLLDVDRPETATPREFAREAVAAGMDERDVEELTDVFRSIRYGNADTTADREERAREAFRGIESEYADGDRHPADDSPDQSSE